MTTPANWVSLDGAANVRDLGGLPLTSGGTTYSGVLIRSDNLQDLSENDVARLLGLGVRTVLDLRSPAEVEAEGPTPLAGTEVTTMVLPLVPELGHATDAAGPSAWLPRVSEVLRRHKDVPVVHGYLRYLRDAPDAIVSAVRAIADEASGGCLVHCAAGKDRTGVTCALVLDAAGVTREAVVADYAASADVIEAVVARLMGSPTYEPDLRGTSVASHAPRPETMHGFLDAVDEQWGGAAGWLLEHGLTADELEALRKRLHG
jgi:protein tyrosine/serine phosphatase